MQISLRRVMGGVIVMAGCLWCTLPKGNHKNTAVIRCKAITAPAKENP